MMTPQLRQAVQAVRDHKALDLNILDLKGICSFTDYFVICTGTSTRHTQAVCDAVVEELKKSGIKPTHVEGYNRAEWILVDYLNFVVHIFLESARHFYDLERLWKTAKRVEVPGS
jgi:ribosome-associated protein